MRRPARVIAALVLLWAAWFVGAVALFVNHALFHGSQVGPGLPIGIASLAIYAAALAGVGVGNRYGRATTLAFLVLSALPLPLVFRMIAERSLWTAGYLAAGFVLKAAGVLLLFTGDSNRWFAADRL